MSYRSGRSDLLFASCLVEGALACCLGCVALGLARYGVWPLLNETKEKLSDPIDALACGTEEGPFELKGSLTVDGFLNFGGLVINEQNNEYYLTNGYYGSLEEPIRLQYEGQYAWVLMGHEVHMGVTGSKEGKLAVEYTASCK